MSTAPKVPDRRSGFGTSAAERLRAILQAEPECVKSVGRDLCLLEMNPAGLRMIEAESMDVVRGADLLQIVLPEFHDQFRKGVERVFAGETVKQRFCIKGLNSTLRWMEQVAAPLYAEDGSGTVVEMLAVTRDVTEQVELERELRVALDKATELNTAKDQFLANTSHEIRTPLNGIVGGVQLLKAGNLPAEQMEFVHMVEASANSLLAVVNDILDYAKLNSAELDVRPEAGDVTETIETAVCAFMPIAKQKSIALKTSLQLHRPELETDHNRLRQVLNNFLSNALKFTNEGEVTVSATQKDLPDGRTETRFEVTDTGIGIPPENLDTVFEPFAQGDPSPTRAYSGTGLGLSICRKLAGLLGGSCGVSSEPGEGSTFWFYIRCPARVAEAPFDKAANEG